MDDREYEYLKRQIASLLDIDIDAYKSRQMRRRLTAFVQNRGGDSPGPSCVAWARTRRRSATCARC